MVENQLKEILEFKLSILKYFESCLEELKDFTEEETELSFINGVNATNIGYNTKYLKEMKPNLMNLLEVLINKSKIELDSLEEK